LGDADGEGDWLVLELAPGDADDDCAPKSIIVRAAVVMP
jgi:hypothetical protein